MNTWLRNKLKAVLWKIGILETHDILLRDYFFKRAQLSMNPLHAGTHFAGFSQLDEYFIINKILDRIPITAKSFIEFGVGTGVENNTLGLILDGWHGIWVGDEELEIDLPVSSSRSAKSGDVDYVKTWVDLKTLESLLPRIQELSPSLVSMDLDGNDYYFTQYLLSSGLRPDIFVQEYNGNFGPTTKWIMPYRNDHQWNLDSNWGASLAAYVDLFQEYGYKLIACSLSGVNAFFVRDVHSGRFTDIPEDVSSLFHSYSPWFERAKQSVDRNILRII